MTTRLLKYAVTALLLAGCASDPTGDEGKGTEPSPEGPGEGQVAIYLGSKGFADKSGRAALDGMDVSWQEDDAIIINRRTCYVRFDKDGAPVVYADKADDDTYTAYHPALLYSKADGSFTMPFAQFHRERSFGDDAMPMYGVCKGGEKLSMDAAGAIVHLKVCGEGYVTSIRLENLAGASIAGICDFDAETGSVSVSALRDPQSRAVVLNCAGTGDTGARLEAAGTDFYIAIPAGTYDNGFGVRISDRSHKFVEREFAESFTLDAGDMLTLPTITYAPDENLLYAQHFDNCTWGGDIVAGKKGFGRGSSATDTAPSAASGTETALQPKLSATPGTAFATIADYTDHTFESPSLQLSQEYLRNRGLDDWRTLYYASEYMGYICGGDNIANSNRGIIRTPHITALGNTPCMAEISFRLCLEEGFTGLLELQATGQGSGDATISGSGTVLLGYAVDGNELDISPVTSTRMSQASPARPKILINPSDLKPGVWHDVTLKVGALSRNTTFRFFPTVIRNARNIYYIDDFVVRRIPYGYEGDYTLVEPTTELGDPAEDVSRLRLRVGCTMSLTEDSAYTATEALGYTYISPGFGSKENAAEARARWEADAEKYGKKAERHGLKIWCMHLPYGNQGEERYYDLCAPDAEHRDSTVRYFSTMIRAAKALKPAYLLIHCNQTLKDNDGSSAESLALSLYELQRVADEIDTQIAVENMSHGVGADIAVLAEAVDKANAMTANGAVKRPVKIAFDIGHANIYLGIKKDGRTVVDWLRAAGTRIGSLHMHDNRGTGVANRTYHDDHLDPGYTKEGQLYGKSGKYGSIGERDLWGEIYYVLLHDCRYRGPFEYESGSTEFGEMTPLTGESEKRYDQVKTPWHVVHNYDTYVYPKFRAYCGK